MESEQITYCKTPIGTAKIVGGKNGISAITVLDKEVAFSSKTPKYLQDCVQQLNAYFNGTLQKFDLKLNPKGTPFQQNVWQELLKIPFGKTRSYLEQSKKMGNAKAIRAVAAANGKNPIWIVIPCHRIIGSNGELTGYAGGLWRKNGS